MEKENFRFRYFREAVLQVIKDLNGEASLQEIYERITNYWKFTSYQMEIDIRLGYERYKHNVCSTLQNLKREGTVENPYRGIWRLSKTGTTVQREKKDIPISGKRTSKLRDGELTTRLKGEIQNIHLYIKGMANTNISNEKLIFLVWFCYNFGLYQEGSAIFAKIDKNTIPDEMYKIAEKISRACEGKLL